MRKGPEEKELPQIYAESLSNWQLEKPKQKDGRRYQEVIATKTIFAETRRDDSRRTVIKRY
jgi:hypothetical protein